MPQSNPAYLSGDVLAGMSMALSNFRVNLTGGDLFKLRGWYSEEM